MQGSVTRRFTEYRSVYLIYIPLRRNLPLPRLKVGALLHFLLRTLYGFPRSLCVIPASPGYDTWKCESILRICCSPIGYVDRILKSRNEERVWADCCFLSTSGFLRTVQALDLNWFNTWSGIIHFLGIMFLGLSSCAEMLILGIYLSKP